MTDSSEPWCREWPAEGLETVPLCPVCGSPERTVLLSNLVDNVFRVAPGKWTLKQCLGCYSAYLDPRPNVATIGAAYETYYTHETAPPTDPPFGLVPRIRRSVGNGYRNWRFGTALRPAISLGRVLVKMLPRFRGMIDAQFRWLPKPSPGQALLDIGCGNGAFLRTAREAGWQVLGLDPDQKACDVARKSGLDVVHGGIEVFANVSEKFDAITLSHVLEHVHDPQQMLSTIFRLLRPEGTLYLQTPNIESRGADIFRSNWRGIETPRHLVLFTPDALISVLQRNGFVGTKLIRGPDKSAWMFLASLRLEKGLSPYDSRPSVLPLPLTLRARFPFVPISRIEFTTIVTRKLR